MRQLARPLALWSDAETRAKIALGAALVASAITVLALVNLYRAWNRPREVVRIGCDGIPALVTIDNASYGEPQDYEVRAFVADFVVKFMRADSYSALNDSVDAARKMAPKLREDYKRVVGGNNGTIALLQRLERRTQIDPAELEIALDMKSVYPWKATVKGKRHIVGENRTQDFDLSLDLVRTSRNELIEGILVWDVRTSGEKFAGGDMVDPGRAPGPR